MKLRRILNLQFTKGSERVAPLETGWIMLIEARGWTKFHSVRKLAVSPGGFRRYRGCRLMKTAGIAKHKNAQTGSVWQTDVSRALKTQTDALHDGHGQNERVKEDFGAVDVFMSKPYYETGIMTAGWTHMRDMYWMTQFLPPHLPPTHLPPLFFLKGALNLCLNV